MKGIELVGVIVIILAFLSFLASNKRFIHTLCLIGSIGLVIYGADFRAWSLVVLGIFLIVAHSINLVVVCSSDVLQKSEPRNCIVIGYPGIGKSTLARNRFSYVDLESTNFIKEDPNWYISYCDTAYDLAQSGYCVFISAHKKVQDYICRRVKNSTTVRLYECSPASYLKYRWIEKLRDRCLDSGSIKDTQAYRRVQDHFCEDVTSMQHMDVNHIILTDMNYDLHFELIKSYNSSI